MHLCPSDLKVRGREGDQNVLEVVLAKGNMPKKSAIMKLTTDVARELGIDPSKISTPTVPRRYRGERPLLRIHLVEHLKEMLDETIQKLEELLANLAHELKVRVSRPRSGPRKKRRMPVRARTVPVPIIYSR
jgi:hypothetical protein